MEINPLSVVSFAIIFFHSEGYLFTLLVAQTANVSAYNAGDLGSIPWSGRSPGEGNGNLLHYSCLENPMDRGAKSWMGLSDFTFTFTLSLAVQKMLNLMRFHLFNFVICITLGGGS